MKFLPTAIPGVVVVEPLVHRDARGFFLETWHAGRFAEAGIAAAFVQDNHSKSARGTLRGLHGQRTRPQGKLVRCVRGAIFDVAADIRPGSPTFGKWAGVTLDEESMRELWIPPGLLHGFCVTSESAEVIYKCTELYAPEDEIGVRWDDPTFGVTWPIAAPLLSAKDAALPTLAELRERLAAR